MDSASTSMAGGGSARIAHWLGCTPVWRNFFLAGGGAAAASTSELLTVMHCLLHHCHYYCHWHCHSHCSCHCHCRCHRHCHYHCMTLHLTRDQDVLNLQHQPRCAGATSLLVQAGCVGWNPLPRIHRVGAGTLPTSRHGLGQVRLPRQTSGAQQQPSLFFAPVCVPWPLPCVGGGVERPRQQRTKKWATLAGFQC